MKRWIKILLLSILFVGIILAIALPLAAQSSIESTEVGINYNKTTKEIDEEKLYQEGRHTIGVANKFIKYETGIKGMQFSKVESRTNDGLLVKISVSFQYRLIISVTDIVELFYRFPYNKHEDAYTMFCRNIFRDVSAQFKAYDFFDKRPEIQLSLSKQTTDTLAKYGAKVENFQLLDIIFPAEYQETISNAQNARLEIDAAQNEKLKAENNAKGTIDKANIDKTTIINEAETQKKQILELTNQEKVNIDKRIKSRKDPHFKFTEAPLSYTGAQLVKHVQIEGVKNLESTGRFKIPIQITAPINVANLFP